MQEEYAGAWQGIFTNKNSLGQAMAIGIATTLIVAVMRRRERRPIALLICTALICLVLLIGSQSMTSLVVLFIALFIGAGGLIGESARGRRYLSFAFLAAGLVLLCVALNFDSTIGLLGRDSSFTGRTDIWPDVIDAIGRRPWLGYGYDTFWLPGRYRFELHARLTRLGAVSRPRRSFGVAARCRMDRRRRLHAGTRVRLRTCVAVFRRPASHACGPC